MVLNAVVVAAATSANSGSTLLDIYVAENGSARANRQNVKGCCAKSYVEAQQKKEQNNGVINYRRKE